MPKETQSPAKNKKCPTCHVRFRSQGYQAHAKKCAMEREDRRGKRKYEKALERRLRALDETLGTLDALNLYPTY